MKKVFVFMMATVVALGLASCSKMEDPARPIEISDSDERSAVIEGNLVYITDVSVAPADQKYTAAANVEIVAVISYADILAPAKPAGNWMKKITTDAAGKFVLNVPANPAGVKVHFHVSEVRGEQKQPGDKTFKGKWKFTIDDQSVVSGQRLILEQKVGAFTRIKENDDKVS